MLINIIGVVLLILVIYTADKLIQILSVLERIDYEVRIKIHAEDQEMPKMCGPYKNKEVEDGD